LYAVLAGMFLGLATYRRVGIARAMRAFTAFATVLVIYQAVNIHDLEIHRGSYVPDNNGISIVDRMFTMNTISHSARFFSFTVIQPFCPSVLQASYDRERLRIEESLWNGPTAGLQQPEFLLSSLVFCAALYFGIAGLRSLIQRENHLPLLTCSLCGSLFAVYAGVTVLGRMNLQPTAAILSSNSYYTYTALLFAILTGFSLWQGVPRSANAHSSLWWNLFLGGLVALSLNGGFKVRLINACLAEKMKEVTTPLDAVNTFVREHRDEPDFSMAIDYQNSDPIPQRYDRWIIDIVFAKWIDPKPKYRIAIRGCDVVIQPQDEHFPMP
ncbi:MAG TPA: hypothetical protein VG097_09545, partial [Gemmata sp.]|nr:hypothetical protein [Gemmata sp.]